MLWYCLSTDQKDNCHIVGNGDFMELFRLRGFIRPRVVHVLNESTARLENTFHGTEELGAFAAVRNLIVIEAVNHYGVPASATQRFSFFRVLFGGLREGLMFTVDPE